VNRAVTIAGLLILIGGYALHARGLFALYHLMRAAELLRLFH
jgi:hypothetical protein